MSGHSKWSTIKRKKGALDAQRGKIFTKLNKEISIAAREGGGDPDANPRLRLAIQNAKGANMPKDNIDRAINKATGADGTDYLEVTYEGYAIKGVGVFVECLTDNLNRTVADVKAIFNKYNGDMGKNGSLEFNFTRKGVFTLNMPEGMDEDDLTLEIIDAGVEDIEVEDNLVTVTTAMEDFGNMQKQLESMGIETENAELQRIPNTMVTLDNEGFEKVMKLIDAMEDNDDVQKVYHNLEVSDEQMNLV